MKKVTKLVDLGYAVARVTRQSVGGGISTQLTLISPSDADEHRYAPAESVQAYITPEYMPAFIEALTAEPVEVKP